MTPIQFSLFFAALVIGYVLVHLRLVKFEGYLRDLSGLHALDERLKGMADGLRHVRLDHVEEQIDQLHTELCAVEEAIGRLQKSITKVRAPAAEARPMQPTLAERIRALVETRLLSLGFGDVRILTDLAALDPDEDVEIVVECTKDDMPRKGRISVRNGSVCDVALKSVAQSFP